MKSTKIAVIVCLLFIGTICTAQSKEMKDIERTIINFSQAGDNSDAESLGDYLDDNYRVIMNRLFGSSEVSVMDKSIYLEKIKSKEFGGDKREVSIESIVINGTTANAKVTFTGTKASFVSLINLIQDQDGEWKLISDIPIFD